MPYCKVVGCNTRPEKGCVTTWHLFPRDIHIKKQWFRRINRVGFSVEDWKAQHGICGRHFLDEDYVYPSPAQALSLGYEKKSFRLKEDAVPSQNMGKPAASSSASSCQTQTVNKPRPSLARQKRQNLEVRMYCLSYNCYIILGS